MSWLQIARITAELAIDLIRGKLGSLATEPAPVKPAGLPYSAVEHQRAQAAAAARAFPKKPADLN